MFKLEFFVATIPVAISKVQIQPLKVKKLTPLGHLISFSSQNSLERGKFCFSLFSTSPKQLLRSSVPEDVFMGERRSLTRYQCCKLVFLGKRKRGVTPRCTKIRLTAPLFGRFREHFFTRAYFSSCERLHHLNRTISRWSSQYFSTRHIPFLFLLKN